MTVAHSLAVALRWYATLSLLAWLAYPISYRCLRPLPDRGLGLVRPLGLLLAVLLPWWLSAVHLLRFSDAVLLGVPLVVGLGLWLEGARRWQLWHFLRTRARQVLAYELATLALFLAYALWRGYNPAIAYTEKPMELGLLTSAFHATRMPPPDVWFAGRSVNYYYLGYVLYAVPARLARIEPGIAFNLALATLFATAVLAAATTAANLAHLISPERRARIVAGSLAPIFLVGIGNLVTPLRLLRHPLGTMRAPWWQGVGWQASRVVVDHPLGGGTMQTINEFPAFTFVLGDLHPHVLAFPLLLAVVAVGLAAACGADRSERFPALALGGAVGGALYAINSWDMPPGLALLGLAALAPRLACLARSGRRHTWRAVGAEFGVAVGAALLVAAPFAAQYSPAVGLSPAEIPALVRGIPVVGKIVQTVGLVGWPKSSLRQLLEVHGLFLALALALLLALATPVLRWRTRSLPLPAAAVLGALLLTAAVGFPALVLFGAPLLLALWLLRVGRLPAPAAYLVGIFALALLMLGVTELVFLQDAFANRMNTVFKVYFEVWSLFAVGCAAAVPLVWQRLRSSGYGWAAWAFAGLLGAVVLGAAAYPPLSAYRWVDGFRTYSGLDGLAYLRQASPGDAAAIAWLQSREREGQHVLEAPGCSYGVSGAEPADRVSAATGLPTPLGWEFHEYQWRNGQRDISAEIAQREADVRAIYSDPTSAVARALLDHYAISYIYVGGIERDGYSDGCRAGPPYAASGLAALGQLGWPRVYQRGDVTIYARPGLVGSATAGH